MNQREVKIKLKKANLFLLALISGGFTLLCLSILGDGVFTLPIALLGAGFFGVCTFLLLTKVLDPRPGLIINDRGLWDNASAVGAGFVSWNSVKSVYVNQIPGQKFLTLEVDNPEEILAKANPFKRFWMKRNKNQFMSPVQIPITALKYDPEKLIELVKTHLNKSRARRR